MAECWLFMKRRIEELEKKIKELKITTEQPKKPIDT